MSMSANVFAPQRGALGPPLFSGPPMETRLVRTGSDAHHVVVRLAGYDDGEEKSEAEKSDNNSDDDNSDDDDRS
jgi:hypothetical protein